MSTTTDRPAPSVDAHKRVGVNLRKSYRLTGYYDIFGKSTQRQRDRWSNTFYLGGASTDRRLTAAYTRAMGESRAAWAYANGVRDAVATIFAYNHPVVEMLRVLTWSFADEYRWHIYVNELHGGGNTAYMTAWEQAMREVGIDLSTLTRD